MRLCSTAVTLSLSLVLCQATLAGATPASVPAPDPFYASLMHDGELLADQGKSAAAVKSLRIACFGMLDQSALLARCLVRLGLAQAASGDGGGFRETFSRLLELESRTPSYGAADIAPPIRRAFEEQVAQRIPSTILVTSPTFEKLATKSGDGKEGKHSRKEEAARVKTDPEPTVEAQAAPRTASAPAPPTTPAPQPKPVPVVPTAPPPAPAATESLTQSPASAATPAPPKGAPAEHPASVAASAPASVPPASRPSAAQPVAPETLSTDESTALEAARTRMLSAKVAADLQAAADAARRIADAHPTSIEANALAGEIFYRGSGWQVAVTYLKRSGPPPGQPLLGFYLAVAEFESGDRSGATATLRPLLGKLQHTPYVQSYIQKILPP